MPELPEVETVCRALRPHLIGRRIADVAVHVPRVRNALDPAALRRACVGRDICAIRRRGKFLVVAFDNGTGLLLHLGMTGGFRVCPADEPLAKHTRVAWELADGLSWRFADARRFGLVQVCRVSAATGLPDELAHFGPEPLMAAFSPAYLFTRTRRRGSAIKSLIMNQEIVAGVGNIYANEACFRAAIRPQRPARQLKPAECAVLVREIKRVLREAIRCGGTTISDFRSVDGAEGRFHVALKAYGRTGEPCPRCGEPHRIQRLVLAGRATFYCPQCQR